MLTVKQAQKKHKCAKNRSQNYDTDTSIARGEVQTKLKNAKEKKTENTHKQTKHIQGQEVVYIKQGPCERRIQVQAHYHISQG
jgi:hypothetical protein